MTRTGCSEDLPLGYARAEPLAKDAELAWVVRYVGLYVVCLAATPLVRSSIPLGVYAWMLFLAFAVVLYVKVRRMDRSAEKVVPARLA